MRISGTWGALLILSAAAAALAFGCDRKVMGGSEEYHRLYGIVNDGRTVNRVQMYTSPSYRPGPWLTFPAGQYVAVNGHERLASRIRQLHPTNLETYLRQDDGVATERYPVRLSLLAIESGHKAWSAARDAERLRERVGSPVPASWGLAQGVVDPQRLRTHIYTALDGDERFPDGRPVLITCHTVTTASGEHRDTDCAGSVYIGDVLAVTFIFPAPLLPQWRALVAQSHALAFRLLNPP